MSRSYSADIIFPISQKPIRDGYITVTDEGKILEIGEKTQGQIIDQRFNGAICPGFINTHCHLELSFMKGQIPEKTGLIEFVKQVVAIRDNFSEAEQKQAITAAASQMYNTGIVAVGDISNDNRSFYEKAKGNLRFHTFVEAFDLGPQQTIACMKTAKQVFKEVPRTHGSTASITPHAPYSCTPELYKLCDDFTWQNGKILSIHNQENPYENQHFIDGIGPWAKLFEDWGTDGSWHEPTGKTSLQGMSPNLSGKNKMLLVHNTFTSEEDMEWAHNYFDEVYWATNPIANEFIEDRLPDYDLWRKCKAQVTIGTDSLASNYQLNILEEIKTIKRAFTHLPTVELLTWATLNGAEALNFENDLGSLEVGKKPGLVHISSLDDQFEITALSEARRIIGSW